MALVFMSLVAAIIAERISVVCGLWLWPLLVALGVLSVLEWRWSEQASHGDLRFYGAVQVYAVLVLLLMLFLPGRYTRTSDLGVVVDSMFWQSCLRSSTNRFSPSGTLSAGIR